MGRPTLCTEEITKEISTKIEGGLSIEDACELSDVSVTSFKNWRNRGRLGEEPYLAFLTEMKKAVIRRKEKNIKKIIDASNDRYTTDADGNERVIKGDWPAIAWLLERQHRREFGRSASNLDLAEPPDGLTEIQKILFLSDEIVRQMARGEITAEEANVAAQVLEQRRKALETGEMAKRLDEIEKTIAGVS